MRAPPLGPQVEFAVGHETPAARAGIAGGGWKHICGPGPVALHALGFRLSFCCEAAPKLKKGSAIPLINYPLVFYFQGPVRARQGLASIFVFPSACVFSFGLGGPPEGLAPTTYFCAAVASLYFSVARGGVDRAV